MSSASPPNRLCIVGLGRVGEEVARQAAKSGHFGPLPTDNAILGTIRRQSDKGHKFALREIDETGHETDGLYRTCYYDKLLDETDFLESCTHVLFALPAPQTDTDQRAMDQLSETLLASLRSACLWIGVISTTGVYGDHKGAKVNEESVCFCRDKESSAGRLWHFEEYWKTRIQQACDKSEAKEGMGRASPVVRVFRCAGIYGGGQSALHTVYKNGAPKPAKAPRQKNSAGSDTLTPVILTNRIHVEDLAAAVTSSMQLQGTKFVSYSTISTAGQDLATTAPFRIYNLSDDLPEARKVVLEYAASIFKAKGIKLCEESIQESKASGRSRRRLTDHKIVSNDRMHEELLPDLTYPTYKEGLDAILEESNTPWGETKTKD